MQQMMSNLLQKSKHNFYSSLLYSSNYQQLLGKSKGGLKRRCKRNRQKSTLNIISSEYTNWFFFFISMTHLPVHGIADSNLLPLISTFGHGVVRRVGWGLKKEGVGVGRKVEGHTFITISQCGGGGVGSEGGRGRGAKKVKGPYRHHNFTFKMIFYCLLPDYFEYASSHNRWSVHTLCCNYTCW